MTEFTLPVGLNETVSDAGVQESVDTVEQINDIFDNGDVELHEAKQLHDHAQQLISHLRNELQVDGDIDRYEETP